MAPLTNPNLANKRNSNFSVPRLLKLFLIFYVLHLMIRVRCIDGILVYRLQSGGEKNKELVKKQVDKR